MPSYLWSIVLFLSLMLVYMGVRLGKKSRFARALWSLMPLIMALPFTSLAGILLELLFGDPNITIFAALVFLVSSLSKSFLISSTLSIHEGCNFLSASFFYLSVV